MKYLNFFILSCVVLWSYTSPSYALSDKWCSNGRYDKNIKPFPKPSFNKCPENARRTMTLKEVESYYLDGAGQEYICNLSKNPLFFSGLHKRKDLKILNTLFLYKQDLLNSSCKEFYRIKIAKKRAIEDKQKVIAAKRAKEDEARKKALAEKKAEEEAAKQKALAKKKAKARAAKKAKEDAASKKALAKKKAEELAKQKIIADKKAEEDAARKEALAKEKAEELAKQKAVAAKIAEEEELKQKILNEKIQKIKDEAQFIVATLKEYVTKDTNKLDILEVSELLENYNSEMQKGWSDTTIRKYEELYDYVQKDEGFIDFSADKKSKQLAAYNKEIIKLREYLTTSQSGLKAFITKNLGSNNAIKALKLAKETKQVLKDFDVTKAMSLKNNIATWKAMNGVAEDKQYTFKILNKKTETIKQSATKQVTQNKPTVTKSVSKVSAKVETSKDYKIGDYPEFLKDKFWYANKKYRENKSCNYIKDQQKISAFTHYSENKVSVLLRINDKALGKSTNNINSGNVKIIKIKPKILIKTDYKFKSNIKSKFRGKWCKNEETMAYDPESEELIRVGCSKTNCSTGLFDPCERTVKYSCSGYPTK